MTGTLHFSIDIDGDRELSRKLHGYLGRVEKWAPFFEPVKADWSETQAKIFAAEGAFEGQEKWADLSAGYAAWKAKKWPGKGILEGEIRDVTPLPRRAGVGGAGAGNQPVGRPRQ